MRNPQAFPITEATIFAEKGLTMRDYFAGQAVVGILASLSGLGAANAENNWEGVYCDGSHTDGPDKFAAFAFGVADAMLAAREQTP